jgi:hypothetical protein
MKLNLSRPLAAIALVALAAAGTAAQARDNVYWSVGIDAAPGVTLGIGNTRPVVVAPAPVYIAPRPIVIAPAPVYYVQPAPVYYQEAYVVHPGKHRGWHKRHHRHHH